MLQCRPIAVFFACIALASAGISDVACGQSVLERPPNLSGGWLGAPAYGDSDKVLINPLTAPWPDDASSVMAMPLTVACQEGCHTSE